MKQLFIVNTPLQLLTSYIVANGYNCDSDNHLLLLQPKGYDSWANSECLHNMANDHATWTSISMLRQKGLKLKQLPQLRKEIIKLRDELLSHGKFESVYLGSDKTIINQLVVELVGQTVFKRFDEGLSSYVGSGRSQWSLVTEAIVIKIARHLLGLNSSMKYNTGGVGCSEAGIADYLYKPQLLKRFSPNPIAIEHSIILDVLAKLTVGLDANETINSHSVLLFLGGKYVEMGLFKAEQEIRLLKRIINIAAALGKKLLYKPHPAESKRKLAMYEQELPEMQYFHFYEPMEVLYYLNPNLKFILSYASAGLIYTDVFSRHEILPISIHKLYENQERKLVDEELLDEMMFKSGVKIPYNMTELEMLFCR